MQALLKKRGENVLLFEAFASDNDGSRGDTSKQREQPGPDDNDEPRSRTYQAQSRASRKARLGERDQTVDREREYCGCNAAKEHENRSEERRVGKEGRTREVRRKER